MRSCHTESTRIRTVEVSGLPRVIHVAFLYIMLRNRIFDIYIYVLIINVVF